MGAKPEDALKGAEPGAGSTTPATVRLTNLNKIYFPRVGVTKGDLIAYYEKVAPVLCRHLEGRPLILERFPEGVDGPSFHQKDAPAGLPPEVPTVRVRIGHSGRLIQQIVGGDPWTITYLVQLGAITMHPWLSRLPNLEHPDQMVLDLDPGGAPFHQVVSIAQVIRSLLDTAGLRSYPKLSGKAGLHIHVPLSAVHQHGDVRRFAEGVARAAAATLPQMATVARIPGKREGKVYVDYLQNGQGKSVASAYSVRPSANATVATPLMWKEVKEGLDPRQFSMASVLERLQTMGDLFSPTLEGGQHLNEARTVLGLKG